MNGSHRSWFKSDETAGFQSVMLLESYNLVLSMYKDISITANFINYSIVVPRISVPGTELVTNFQSSHVLAINNNAC